MRTPLPFCLAVAVALALAGCRSAGREAVPPDASPAEILARGQAEREAGNLEVAEALFERIVDDHAGAPEALEAEWLAALAAYEQGDLKRARKRFQDFHETHPLFYLGELEELVYDIGTRLYEKGRSGILGLGILPTKEEGIITLTWLTENLPTGSRADDAFFFMGTARVEDNLHEEGVAFFEDLLVHHPESEWRYEALFSKGKAHLALNRGPAYDLDSLVAARKDLRAYVKEVEDDPGRREEYADRLAEARASLAEIDARIAAKNLLIAEFYLSLERPASAEPYLRASAEEYAETEAGREARRILEELRSSE